MARSFPPAAAGPSANDFLHRFTNRLSEPAARQCAAASRLGGPPGDRLLPRLVLLGFRIATAVFNAGVALLQAIPERNQGIGSLALADEDDRTALQVQHDGPVTYDIGRPAGGTAVEGGRLFEVEGQSVVASGGAENLVVGDAEGLIE